MSAEVVKKRGRPKKVIDPIEVEKPDILGKSATRAKSTKVIAKQSKAKPAISAKPSMTPKAVPNPLPSPSASPKPTSATPTSAAQAEAPNPISTPESKQSSVIQPTEAERRSKILVELRKKGPGPFTKIGTVVPANANPHAANYIKPATSTSSQPISSPSAPTKPSIATGSHIKANNASPPPSTKPNPTTSSHNGTSKPQFPFKEMNAEIVSKISSAAGAKPGSDKTNMASKYKSTARRITATIVALPIMLVTSWVLYERLYMGEDRKRLIPPELLAGAKNDGEKPSTT